MGILENIRRKRKYGKYKMQMDKLARQQTYQQTTSKIKRRLPKPIKAEKFISRLKSKRFTEPSVKLARFVTGSKIAMPVRIKKSGTTTGRIGRPRGPSGKYYIPKVGAVGVYQWRRWVGRQKAMQRMRLAQQMAYAPQRYVQRTQPSVYNDRQQQPSQYPQTPPSQYPQPQQPQPQQLGLMSGWDLFKIKLPSASNPNPNNSNKINFMKGAEIFNSELPVTNPYGEYYTEPDLFTGHQILKRRIRDRSFQN